MDKIEIVKVDIDALEQLQVIGRQTFSETFADSNTEENMRKYLEEEFTVDKLSSELTNPFSAFYFAILEDTVIGYLKINFGHAQTELKEPNALEIERIYVLKAFHGKKVGQLLYVKAIEIAKNHGSEFIWLGVWEENTRAIQFYKKNGFVEFDKHIFVLGDDMQTDIMMRRSLQDENH